MGKKNLTLKKKTVGTFIRLEPSFKKKAQVYAIEHGTNLTDLIIDALIGKMNSKDT